MCGANLCTATQATSSFIQSKNARRRDQINMQMVQNILLIWLDGNIDENSSDCQNSLAHLRRVVNAVNIFTDKGECIQFLDDMAKEKVCMIISGAFSQSIVPRVHDLSQIDSIFIFCDDETYHEEWAKKWPKIKGVYTEIKSICDALKEAAQQCEQNAIPISIMDASDTLSGKNLNQLDSSFMYTQIMKEILLTIDFKQQHIDKFIKHCRHALNGNPHELKYVDQLSREYRKRTPIWWYTLDCFLYSMLNHALRSMNADLMVKLGFFIADLHRQIKQLHRQQFGGHGSKQNFIVYRGQGMEKVEFKKMVNSKGGLISFNCFLSTSKTRQISLDFAKRALRNPQLVGVIFVMTIDPTLSDTPFASVAGVGALGAQEDEILLSMNSVFRIGQIKNLDDDSLLFCVELRMTSEKDKDLHRLIERIREETFPDAEGWSRLGLVLWKMGAVVKAQEVFEVLLQQTTEERSKAAIYNQLGLMANDLGQYNEAIGHYKESIRIEEKQKPRNHLSLAQSYNNIGGVYGSMGDYPKALFSHEKALAIRTKSLPPTDFHLATSYNNIGLVYDKMADYPKALLSHEKALAIKRQSLPPTHPDLASSYFNIGSVYYRIGDYSKALLSHEKALEIQQKSLPPTHHDLASSYNSIGSVYHRMGDYPKALVSLEKALTIRQKSLPPTHPDLASSHMGVANVYDSMGDYSKALSSHKTALVIKQRSLPPIHPDLASSHMGIANVYDNMGDYWNALSSYEKALAISEQSLPPTHPDLASVYNNMGAVYQKMKNYSKAHWCYEHAVYIAQYSLPSDHPDLKIYHNNLATVKRRLL